MVSAAVYFFLPKMDCLEHHRKRQWHFGRACMADFQQSNKSWVILTDVDEYTTFDTKHDNNDPPIPLYAGELFGPRFGFSQPLEAVMVSAPGTREHTNIEQLDVDCKGMG